MARSLEHDNNATGKGYVSPVTSSKLSAPEFLLFLVITFLLWSVGFVDLLAHPATDPTYAVVGPYSRGVAALIAVYALLFLLWLALLLLPRSHLLVQQAVIYGQDRNWLAFALMAAIFFVSWHILTRPNWLKYPGMSTTLLLFVLLLGSILLFWRWGQRSTARLWRKSIVAVLLAAITLELAGQAGAFFGLFPNSIHYDGGYVSQGRILHNQEGFGNGTANAFGWYYPEFRLEPGTYRIGLIGDTYIQALQINPDQHLGVVLEEQINQNSGGKRTEILALGYPGYGPGLYLDPEMLDFAQQAFALDEVIVAIHVGNDLRNLTRPSDLDVYFEFAEPDTLTIHRDNLTRWHDVAHYALTGYEPYHPLRVVKSHYLTPVLWRTFFSPGFQQQDTFSLSTSDPTRAGGLNIPGVRGVIARQSDDTLAGHTPVLAMDLVETSGLSDFLFERDSSQEAREAFEITRLLLARFQAHAREHGIKLRVVTIPVFPESFYQTYQSGPWSSELGAYDLFLPERMLHNFAQENDIPMLAMGQRMLEDGLTAAQLQSFYYSHGTGHFTPEGHAYFATSIEECFYKRDSRGDTSSSVCFGN